MSILGASRRKWHNGGKRSSSSLGHYSSEGSPSSLRGYETGGLQMMRTESLTDLNRSLSSLSLNSVDSFASDNLSAYSGFSTGSALPHHKGSRIPIIKRNYACL